MLLQIPDVQFANEGPYQVVISDAHGSVTSSVANLYVTGTMLPQQPAPDAFNPGSPPDGPSSIALQTDGRIIAGGYISSMAGQTCSLARLNG